MKIKKEKVTRDKKEKADYVTDKIDNDGLYKAFKHLKLFQNQK